MNWAHSIAKRLQTGVDIHATLTKRVLISAAAFSSVFQPSRRVPNCSRN